MNSRARRKILLTAAVILMPIGMGTFTAGTASAISYPSAARTIYLTADRSIHPMSNCWAQTAEVDDEGDTGVASGCSLTLTG